ncbi:helix-turn-helix domain-containing protein [Pseudomonas sp. HN2-3]|uniref:helix-turn-helix domain-containing protein n=1 Tax=Pseudomonas sp. HN2-3 TaxID=2886360 RepID=UPI001D11EA66|nr:helix-turn-helix transcriptional regulator [Pseudomonas sp. HN2-3]UDU83133.1 helix-turn-helix transcriptional regulator [Pseudomonas sp. HN2-3]
MPYSRKNEECVVHNTSEPPNATDQSDRNVRVIDAVLDKEKEGGCLSALQTKKAQLYMIQNMSSGVLISAVAQACHLSRSHFSRAFRNSTGCSPRDWIRRAKLLQAAKLLTYTDQAIAEVALACGFADQSHFTRAFAKTLGISPGKWRALRTSVAKDDTGSLHFFG